MLRDMTPSTPPSSTRDRLRAAALELFSTRGFEQVTVAEVAAAAGVSHMTFFRHFPTKESVVLDDPWDPMIAAVVGATDRGLPTLERVRRGFLSVAAGMDAHDDDEARRRVRLAAATPLLRAQVWANTEATQAAVVAALVADGTSSFDARVATGACMGALTAGLMEWGASDDESLGEWIRRALAFLVDQEPVRESARGVDR